MTVATSDYGITTDINLPYERAVEVTKEALAQQGFGVLTEIDIRETLKKKLDVDFRPYIILGACNPPLAHQALRAVLDIGLLLPCNVIVRAGDRGGTSVVAAIDPVKQLGVTSNSALEPGAIEVKGRLERMLEKISS